MHDKRLLLIRGGRVEKVVTDFHGSRKSIRKVLCAQVEIADRVAGKRLSEERATNARRTVGGNLPTKGIHSEPETKRAIAMDGPLNIKLPD